MKENLRTIVVSLIMGLVIGSIVGTPLGWKAHEFYTEQHLSKVLICREKNRNLPEDRLQEICGSRF